MECLDSRVSRERVWKRNENTRSVVVVMIKAQKIL